MNKRALLLYNPYSGHKEIVFNLDYVTSRIQSMGYYLSIYRSEHKGSIENYICERVDDVNTEIIIVSGGDGTINECINGMLKKNLTIPLAILPLGTANDFAHTLGIPSKLPQALDVIEEGYCTYTDVGCVNDEFFVNVCNMGAFCKVSHEIDLDLKNKFGKFAYYVKGFDALQHYEEMKLEIIAPKESFEGTFFLILIFNGRGAGGFMKLAKDASVYDGLFDVVCFKDISFQDMPLLFLKVLQGEHLDDPHVLYFKTDQLMIKKTQDDIEYCTDIDGEKGPELPLDIRVLPQRIKVYIPRAL